MVSRSVQRSSCASLWKYSKSVLYMSIMDLLYLLSWPVIREMMPLLLNKAHQDDPRTSFSRDPNHPVRSLLSQYNRLTGYGKLYQSQKKSIQFHLELNDSAEQWLTKIQSKSLSHTPSFIEINNKHTTQINTLANGLVVHLLSLYYVSQLHVFLPIRSAAAVVPHRFLFFTPLSVLLLHDYYDDFRCGCDNSHYDICEHVKLLV